MGKNAEKDCDFEKFYYQTDDKKLPSHLSSGNFKP